jgi:hypothetical protein
MNTTGRLVRACGVAAALGLAAACAPVSGPASGIAVGISPGAMSGLEIRSGACTYFGVPTPQAGAAALSSMSGFAGMRNRINQLVAEYALGARSNPLQPSAAWKRVATGEC